MSNFWCFIVDLLCHKSSVFGLLLWIFCLFIHYPWSFACVPLCGVFCVGSSVFVSLSLILCVWPSLLAARRFLPPVAFRRPSFFARRSLPVAFLRYLITCLVLFDQHCFVHLLFHIPLNPSYITLHIPLYILSTLRFASSHTYATPHITCHASLHTTFHVTFYTTFQLMLCHPLWLLICFCLAVQQYLTF